MELDGLCSGPKYAKDDIRCRRCEKVYSTSHYIAKVFKTKDEKGRPGYQNLCQKCRLKDTDAKAKIVKKAKEKQEAKTKRRRARVIMAKPRTAIQRAQTMAHPETPDNPPVRHNRALTAQDLPHGRGGFETFAAFFWKIRNKAGDLVPFILNRAQKIIITKIERQIAAKKPIRIRVLKYRQAGISTFATLFCLWWTLTHAGHNVISIANRMDLPKKWVGNLRLLVAQINAILPDGTGPKLKTESEMGVSFWEFDSSYMIGSSEGRTPGMGNVLQGVHFSEKPYWQNPDETVTELIPAVPFKRNTFVIVESTGLSIGDAWYKDYYEAKNGIDANGEPSAYDWAFLPWFLDLEYSIPGVERRNLEPLGEDELAIIDAAKEYGQTEDGIISGCKGVTAGQLAWRRAFLSSEFHGDKEIFANKFPSTEEEAFLAGGANIFKKPLPQLARKTQRKHKYTASIFTEMGMPDLERHDWVEPHSQFRYVIVKDEAGDVKIWEEPNENYHYILGADCQWGTKSKILDYDVLHVECLETGKLVAKMKGRYDLFKWGRNISAMGYYYNTCPIAPETNSQAAVVMMPLLIGNVLSWRYPNIWVRTVDWKLKGSRPEDYGWYTSHQSKGDLVQFAMTTTLTGDFDWCDEDTIIQLAAFIRNDKGEFTAPVGMHDDDLMSRMITAYVAHVERPGTDLYVEKKAYVFTYTTPAERLKRMMEDDDEDEVTPEEEREKLLEAIYG